MCIGIPLQVTALEPGHAVCDDHGTPRRVRTALVGDNLQPGDWLLVFIDSAVELLTPERAAEITHTLALLGAALAGPAATEAATGFDLPSSWSAADLQALTGAARAAPHLETTP